MTFDTPSEQTKPTATLFVLLLKYAHIRVIMTRLACRVMARVPERSPLSLKSCGGSRLLTLKDSYYANYLTGIWISSFDPWISRGCICGLIFSSWKVNLDTEKYGGWQINRLTLLRNMGFHISACPLIPEVQYGTNHANLKESHTDLCALIACLWPFSVGLCVNKF